MCKYGDQHDRVSRLKVGEGGLFGSIGGFPPTSLDAHKPCSCFLSDISPRNLQYYQGFKKRHGHLPRQLPKIAETPWLLRLQLSGYFRLFSYLCRAPGDYRHLLMASLFLKLNLLHVNGLGVDALSISSSFMVGTKARGAACNAPFFNYFKKGMCYRGHTQRNMSCKRPN